MFYLLGLFNITRAAITPGTQPQSHNKNTMNIEPQPLSITAKGGQIIESNTLQKLILIDFIIDDYVYDVFQNKLLQLNKEFYIYSHKLSKVSSISPGVLMIFIKVPMVSSGQCKAILYLPCSMVASFPCKMIS